MSDVVDFAIVLNVPDPPASVDFLSRYFGYRPVMGTSGYSSLKHPDGGPSIIFLRTGLPVFKPSEVAGSAGQGMLLVLAVRDLDHEHERLASAGVEVVTAPEPEGWGQRFAQYRDPNGLIVHMVQWV